MLLRTFRREGEGWGKNPWIEPLASWDSVQLQAKDQNSSVEIGLSDIVRRVECTVAAQMDLKRQRGKAMRAALLPSMGNIPKKPGQGIKR